MNLVIYGFIGLAVLAFIFTIIRNVKINKEKKYILENYDKVKVLLPGSPIDIIDELERSKGNPFMNMIPFLVIAGILKFIFI